MPDEPKEQQNNEDNEQLVDEFGLPVDEEGEVIEASEIQLKDPPILDVKTILLQGNYVTQEDMHKAIAYAQTHNLKVEDYLLGIGIINKDLLGQAIAEYFKLPYIDLNTKEPPREQVLKIPERWAKTFAIVLFYEDQQKVVIATDNPRQQNLMMAAQQLFPGRQIFFGYALTEDVRTVFKYYRKPLKNRFIDIIKSGNRVAANIIEAIIEDSMLYKSSDIHLEPQEKEVIIRFRIDGVLQEMGRISKQHYENILNWVKVKSHLRIDEHFAAQDGSLRLRYKDFSADLRISIVPVLDGEKIVIRILAQYVGDLSLSGLGIGKENERSLMKSASSPFGMILVTGPTGSGKTTTLYSLLKILNKPEINITTIEDPVEYKLEGINHIQVNNATNLTFAQGLRSIVRQDPDIILVGEIRDKETAEIAVNAALTGHLLLSTFHANDAPTAIPRLLDMGIEEFLLASTIEVIVAQRLVRRICESCRYSKKVNVKDLEGEIDNPEQYFDSDEITLYEGKGCKACSGTGYKGRVGIYEFVRNTKEMKELILSKPSAERIWELAKQQGTNSFFEDGLTKVKSGVTTIEELIRVARPS